MSNADASQAEERAAVILAMRGDRHAFRLLVDRYDQRLLYFVRRTLGEVDGAYDVVQAVWLIVHSRIHTLQSPNAFRVWLYRIAHSRAVSELRRKMNRPMLLEDMTAVAPDDDTAEGIAFENAELVHTALGALSLEHRQVLTLRFLEEMSIQEIVEVTGWKSGTVRSRLHYAKLALRERVEELIND